MDTLKLIATIMFFVAVVVNVVCEIRCIDREKEYERLEKEDEKREKEKNEI